MGLFKKVISHIFPHKENNYSIIFVSFHVKLLKKQLKREEDLKKLKDL